MLTRKERLLNIFKGVIPDRSAVKIWGVTPFQKCNVPAFEPVRRLAVEKTDLVLSATSPFNLYCGCNADQVIETYDKPAKSSEWINQVKIFHTPKGILKEIFARSTTGKPGYRVEHPIKKPSDIRKLLSLPYTPYPFLSNSYIKMEHDLGDAGIVMFSLDHALYGLVRLIGSQNFALWSYQYKSLLLEAISIYSERICEHAKTALSHGITGIFGWVGPELCIPPLMSPSAFETFCYGFDKDLTDIIHNGGGYVWLHCHGKMRDMLKYFVDMGIDVLNPIEPPPMGDIKVNQAFEIVGNQMALEGGIQTHDLMTCTKEAFTDKLHTTLEAGSGKRFILCPSAGYMSNTEPSKQEIENWMVYIQEGVRYAKELS